VTRIQMIEALLRSLFDYLPGPKTTRLADVAGEAPTQPAPCKPCGGQGTFGKRKRQCAACGGTGTVMVDPYTGETVSKGKGQRVKTADPRRIDAELARLARDEAVRRGRLLDDPFQWEAERIRYRRHGSYAALERALEGLRANEPDLYSLTMRVLVYQSTPRSPEVEGPLGLALRWLDRRMPPEIRVPRWVTQGPKADRDWPKHRGRDTRPARKARNEQIIRLAQEGVPRARIAEEMMVSQATVSRVLAPVDLAGTVAA
jgi:ribosomal protein L37E